ncbi:MAG: TssQ family T6SS-associated lipoprotein [Pseudomonadota bacterium]|nr:TssQ family T6SS-associated lipoprotein [Rubrivivax sp.]
MSTALRPLPPPVRPARTGRRSAFGAASAALALAVLAGCATPPPPPPPPPPVGLADLMDRPAERALYEGMRSYEDGQYLAAESHLRRALDNALRSARDRAVAHKLIAFITCTSERTAECEFHFRAARAADPAFQLSRPEAGHPIWGPVYRRIAGQ